MTHLQEVQRSRRMLEATQKTFEEMRDLYKQCMIAMRIAFEAHKGQYRKNSKEPYVTHPYAVADMFGTKSLNDLACRVVSYVHDVLEDNPSWTAQRLLDEGIVRRLVCAVESVTKQKGEFYLDFILRAKEDSVGQQVKIADITHNMSDLEEGQRKEKYRLALHVLNS